MDVSTSTYDQAGKLVGNWFLEGVTRKDINKGIDGGVGTKEVAFVYDTYER